MKLLLDTHALLWFLGGDARLSATARSATEDAANDAMVSVASLWEIAVKASLNKLVLHRPFGDLFPALAQK